MTEGISDTKTNDGKYTVNEQGYLLENGTTVEVTSVSNGTLNGKNLTVAAGATANVTVTVTVSDADKEYLNKFENGMYVEGFVILTATAGTEISLSAPFLAFYGDWTVAPLFDIDYFETNADELGTIDNLYDGFTFEHCGGSRCVYNNEREIEIIDINGHRTELATSAVIDNISKVISNTMWTSGADYTPIEYAIITP